MWWPNSNERDQRSLNTCVNTSVAKNPASIIAWVSPTIYASVLKAAKTEGLERLKPIYLALGEKVSYDDIRLVVTHLTSRSNPSSA